MKKLTMLVQVLVPLLVPLLVLAAPSSTPLEEQLASLRHPGVDTGKNFFFRKKQ